MARAGELAGRTEQSQEDSFVRGVHEMGLEHLKAEFPGNDGWPDRLMPLPAGLSCWVELKKKGETIRPLQRERIRQLQRLGHFADWFDDYRQALAFVRACLAAALSREEKR